MFWDTEAMAVAKKSAEAHIGSVGRYIEKVEPKFIGAKLYSDNAGVFWFGDLESKANIAAVAGELQETVYVLPNDGHSKNDALLSVRPPVAQR